MCGCISPQRARIWGLYGSRIVFKKPHMASTSSFSISYINTLFMWYVFSFLFKKNLENKKVLSGTFLLKEWGHTNF